jgi:hypothetical protein
MNKDEIKDEDFESTEDTAYKVGAKKTVAELAQMDAADGTF